MRRSGRPAAMAVKAAPAPVRSGPEGRRARPRPVAPAGPGSCDRRGGRLWTALAHRSRQALLAGARKPCSTPSRSHPRPGLGLCIDPPAGPARASRSRSRSDGMRRHGIQARLAPRPDTCLQQLVTVRVLSLRTRVAARTGRSSCRHSCRRPNTSENRRPANGAPLCRHNRRPRRWWRSRNRPGAR